MVLGHELGAPFVTLLEISEDDGEVERLGPTRVETELGELSIAWA